MNIAYQVKKGISQILISILLSAFYIYADDQSWLNNSLKLSLNPKVSLIFTQESRNNELTFISPYLSNVQGGISYSIFSKAHVSLLYKLQVSKKTGSLLHESRYTCEVGWKTEFSQISIFDILLRSEVRIFNGGHVEDHLRLRLRMRFTYKAAWGNFSFHPFIATEPFGDTLQNKIHQNRFYAGIVFPLSKKAYFLINYIRQDTRQKETLHILNSGFRLKF